MEPKTGEDAFGSTSGAGPSPEASRASSGWYSPGRGCKASLPLARIVPTGRIYCSEKTTALLGIASLTALLVWFGYELLNLASSVPIRAFPP